MALGSVWLLRDFGKRCGTKGWGLDWFRGRENWRNLHKVNTGWFIVGFGADWLLRNWEICGKKWWGFSCFLLFLVLGKGNWLHEKFIQLRRALCDSFWDCLQFGCWENLGKDVKEGERERERERKRKRFSLCFLLFFGLGKGRKRGKWMGLGSVWLGWRCGKRCGITSFLMVFNLWNLKRKIQYNCTDRWIKEVVVEIGPQFSMMSLVWWFIVGKESKDMGKKWSSPE